MQKRYHLIAIGGSVMHNLALDLLDMGHKVSGSDDEIYEPSRSRLEERGILPQNMGWDATRISGDIDVVILGKHAREDNPELIRALELGIRIQSFPEFIASASSAKVRVCIAGSHGKTSTTAMIMHVLKKRDFNFDYLVGAQLEGFEKMVRVSGAPILITEGDEYPSSALDMRAKMLHYEADIAVVTGLAWDHVNIYKTYPEYIEAFRQFVNSLPADGVCFFDQTDPVLNRLIINESFPVERISYAEFYLDRRMQIEYASKSYPVKIFGRHNMLNLRAAFKVCQMLGVSTDQFFEAISDFKGASKRLELFYESENLVVFRDFAHAPSKCQASVHAVRERFPKKRIKAILELHTYSSLDINFLKEYEGTMSAADDTYVFYDLHALKMKKMPELKREAVRNAFGGDIQVVNTSDGLKRILENTRTDGTEILLLMSSGSIGGIHLDEIFTSRTSN